MKFKVGDKVKVRQDLKINEQYGNLLFVEDMQKMKGKTVTINKEEYDGSYRIKEFDYRWTDEMLEYKANFRKSDLKDGDIITYRNGKQVIVVNSKVASFKLYNNDLTHKSDKNYDIVRIEHPSNYQTVFERKEEILDEAEKRYLRDVIKPLRKEIDYISKTKWSDDEQYITLGNNKSLGKTGSLPNFEKDTMYKGMKEDKKYSLEELGL